MIDSVELAALLVLGHVLADFAFQTKQMVAGKHRIRPWLFHVGVVFAAQSLLLVPILPVTGVLVIAALAITHGIIDWAKSSIQKRTNRQLWPFLADQALHAASLIIAWQALKKTPLNEWPSWWPNVDAAEPALVLAAFIFNGIGAGALVRALLADFGPVQDRDGVQGAGFLIGVLERWLILTLALVGQWSAIGLVVAAKSLVRMDRFHDDKSFAEYYLLGTFSSLLLAIGSALLVQWVG